MRRIIGVAALAILATLPSPLPAQRRGTWELGGFGRYNFYDNSFKVVDSTEGENRFGGGARVGYFLAPRWSLELDGSANATDLITPTAQSVGLIYWPFHLRATYHAPLGGGERFSWLLGAGLNYNRYNVSNQADQFLSKKFEGDDWGAAGQSGFRYRITEWLSARADATLDIIPSPQNDADGSNTQWGLQLGLSLLLGTQCADKLDSIRVEPRTSTIFVGEQVQFRVRGTLCDGSPSDATAATTAALVGGGATLAGMTFSSTTPGTYQVRFENPGARKVRSDQATVTVNARPAPAVTLTRVDLRPDQATVFINEAVPLTVVGFWSDGSSRDLTNCQITPDGGTVTGGAFSATVAGSYTVTAVCEGGQSDRSTITVRTIQITVRALFEFNQTSVYVQAELDSLRSLAQTLREHPSLQLTLYGHTDWVGSVAYNERLGTRRVQAVVDSLKAFGVPADRLDGFGKRSFGECQPVADNRSGDGRRLNRRVEIFDTPSARQYDGGATCRERP